MTTTTQNPWADRWENELAPMGDPVDGAMMRHEANQARSYPPRTCQVCGADSFYRPGVGGWWCADRHLWKATRTVRADQVEPRNRIAHRRVASVHTTARLTRLVFEDGGAFTLPNDEQMRVSS